MRTASGSPAWLRVRACDYYGVSADFLLGRTLTRDGTTIAPEELYDLSDEKDNSMRGSVLALLSKSCW